MSKIVASLVLATGLFAFASPAQAAIACSNADISPTAIDCAGFFAGNLVNSGPNEPLMASALAELGFTYTGDSNGIEQFNANGGSLVNFNTLLAGPTIVGVHFGNGVGSPGRPDNSTNGDGDDTAFYLFNAGAGLDTFTLNFAAASTVTLFQTGSPVPEPGTWATMLIGFGLVGFAMRRRKARPSLMQMA